MASSSSTSSYHPQINCSKTQMCLFKILHTISSIPPSKDELLPSNNRGVCIDLNQGLFSVEEQSVEPEPSSEPDPSATDQGNISDNKGGDEAEEGVLEMSVETKVQSFEVDGNGAVQAESESEGKSFGGGETASLSGRGQDGKNYLDLLIEAARVLADESGSEEEGRLGGAELTASQGASEGRVKKQKERWMVVDLYDDVLEAEREPVVRSKRGRNQALPQRFRDSVVEPLKRASRRQRSKRHLR